MATPTKLVYKNRNPLQRWVPVFCLNIKIIKSTAGAHVGTSRFTFLKLLCKTLESVTFFQYDVIVF
ncbi:hypothetical protein FC87_GL001168 [Fructilactobacillus florum DSM 22689 = JCM 16035]|uniref:Uncharacterized protein n=1 Tax=Fructilactobacillus florum DSM 22689 = JCM 16035 TaxID=1423745 RepID=A0A0R2CIC6_9LACO|nr:hypothetical protein FC87_GL001168 [Fructilactobacillus florum DSM 22689 = JCM 16035]